MIQGKENLRFVKDLLKEWTEKSYPDEIAVSDIEESLFWNESKQRYELDYGFLGGDSEYVKIFTGDYAVDEILEELGEEDPIQNFNEMVGSLYIIPYISSSDKKLYWLFMPEDD